MPAATLLSITGIDLGLYSARGLTMELSLIQTPDLRRNWNGTLIDTANSAFHKYAVSITNEDSDAPVLTDVQKGDAVTVTCIPGLGVTNTTADVLVMDMLVTDYSVSRKEYDARSQWTLNLEQV